MYDKNIDSKLSQFQNICCTTAKTFKHKMRVETFYKVVATPTVAFGSETWTLNQNVWNRIQVVEIKFPRSDKGSCRFHRIRNKVIREELKIDNITKRNKIIQKKPGITCNENECKPHSKTNLRIPSNWEERLGMA